MAWFRYFKSTEVISSSVINTNYSYPLSKRTLSSFIPVDTVSQGSWLFANISEYDISSYLDSNLEKQTDDTSYLVVYEKGDNFYPVKCVIEGLNIYFQAYENHVALEPISGLYCIYYNTPNIRKINQVNNGGDTEYQVNLASSNPYYGFSAEVNIYSFLISVGSSTNYNFSFVNSATDWNNGVTEKVGAKTTFKITGPNLIVKGNKGPDFGKIKILASPNIKHEPGFVYTMDWVDVEEIVDCFSNQLEENVVLYETNNLRNVDYFVEIENLSQKNISSTNNKIKLTSFSFSYNPYLNIAKENINKDVHRYNQSGGVS